jgi:hypothetical protein
MKEKVKTSTCWAMKKEIRLAAVIRILEPKITAYESCRPHVGFAGSTIHKPIIANINMSMNEERFTNHEEVFLPYTSPTMSVTRKRIGMKNTPTDARIDPSVVIFEPNVFTNTIEVR